MSGIAKAMGWPACAKERLHDSCNVTLSCWLRSLLAAWAACKPLSPTTGVCQLLYAQHAVLAGKHLQENGSACVKKACIDRDMIPFRGGEGTTNPSVDIILIS